jgi:hypothetical protein
MIRLSSGTFTINASIIIPVDGRVLLQGSGREATTIYLANASNCNMIEAESTASTYKNWENTFRDFKLYGNKANQTTGGNGFDGGFYSCKFENLNIDSVWGWGIYLHNTIDTAQENRITGVHFTYNGHTSKDTNHSGGAIRLGPKGMDTWVIDCIDFDSYGNESVYVENSPSNHFVNSTFAGWGHVNYGIYVLGNSFWGLINACRIDGPFDKSAIYLDASTASIVEWTITNNIIRTAGKAADNTYNAIDLVGSASTSVQYCIIANNYYHHGYSGGNEPKYFINAAQYTDYCIITGNLCVPGETGSGNVYTTGSGGHHSIEHNIP